MLVLTRTRGQSLVFPALGVSVEVLQVRRKKVKVGIDGPTVVPVHRTEVASRINGKELRNVSTKRRPSG